MPGLWRLPVAEVGKGQAPSEIEVEEQPVEMHEPAPELPVAEPEPLTETAPPGKAATPRVATRKEDTEAEKNREARQTRG